MQAKPPKEKRRSSKAAGEKKSALTSAEGGPAQGQAEVPFAKRAKEQGKLFQGDKPDGECVIISYDVAFSMDR